MSDRDRIEAWIRRKPKRVVQSQTVIVALCLFVAGFGIPIGAVTFTVVFMVPYGVLATLIGWGCLAVSFITFKLWYHHNER